MFLRFAILLGLHFLHRPLDLPNVKKPHFQPARRILAMCERRQMDIPVIRFVRVISDFIADSIDFCTQLSRQNQDAPVLVCLGKLYDPADWRIVERFEINHVLCT